MFNSVEFVRNLCKQRGIAISQLEKDCGFSNGYLNPKKMTKLPYARAVSIAKYLHVTAQEILTGELPTEIEASDILDQVDIAFYGEFKELVFWDLVFHYCRRSAFALGIGENVYH